MKLPFAERAWDDYLHWQPTDSRRPRRINELHRATLREPFDGPGHPEPLRHLLSGYWSRRIDTEHRMVYRVTEAGLEIAQLRYPYEAAD